MFFLCSTLNSHTLEPRPQLGHSLLFILFHAKSLSCNTIKAAWEWPWDYIGYATSYIYLSCGAKNNLDTLYLADTNILIHNNILYLQLIYSGTIYSGTCSGTRTVRNTGTINEHYKYALISYCTHTIDTLIVCRINCTYTK